MRATTICITLASAAMLTCQAASAQISIGYGFQTGSNPFYYSQNFDYFPSSNYYPDSYYYPGNVFYPSGYYYPNRYYNRGYPRGYWNYQQGYNNSGSHRNHNAEIAIGSAIIGGVLGYVLAQNQSANTHNRSRMTAQNTYYAPSASYPSNYGWQTAQQGYVTAPRVQQGYVTPAPIQQGYVTAPVQEPVYTQPQRYETQIINGRTYYRPAPPQTQSYQPSPSSSSYQPSQHYQTQVTIDGRTYYRPAP